MTERDPIGVQEGKLSGSFGPCGNPCAALHKRLTLLPGEEKRILFYLGTGNEHAAKRAKIRYDAAGTDRASSTNWSSGGTASCPC